MNEEQIKILKQILSKHTELLDRTQDIIFKLQQRVYELERQVEAIVDRIDND